MEGKKTLKKTAYFLGGLSIVVLIVLSVFQHQQIKELSENVATETVLKDEFSGEGLSGRVETQKINVAKSTNPTTKGKDHNVEIAAGNEPLAINEEQDADEIAELEYQLEATEEELDKVHKQLSDKAKKESELLEKELELAKKRLEDPSSMKIRRDIIKTRLFSRYALLFNRLNLAPDKLDQFKEILLDEETASMEYSVEIMDVPGRGKQVVSIVRSKDPGDEYQIKIGELLGEDDYDKYQAFKERRSEVYQVNSFNDILNSGEKLTDNQQMELIDAMYVERELTRTEQVSNETQADSPPEINEEEIERRIKTRERRDEAYIEASRDILSDSQIEQFTAYLKQQHDRMESSMRLQAQMEQKQTTQDSDEEK